MPYISGEARQKLDPHIEALADAIREEMQDPVDFAGLLNNSCTRLALAVLPERRYWAFATVSGVFRNLLDEFYRRSIAPYEDKKIAEHGDVFPSS